MFLIFHRDNYVPGTSPVSIFRYFTNTYVCFVQYYTMRKIEKNKRFSKNRLGETTLKKNNLDPSLTPTENLKKTGLTAKVNADINSCGVPTGVDLECKGHKAVEFLVF